MSMRIIDDVIDTTLPIRRLRRNTLSLINAHPAMQILCIDKFVTGLATGLGLETDNLVILRVLVELTPVTLVVIPNSVWASVNDHARLIELKETAAFTGHRCILVQEGFIQRQPRLDNSRLIEASGAAAVTADQRISLLAYLIANGPSSLADCATAIHHDTPAAAILQMSASGIVTLKCRGHIGPDTTISLPGVHDSTPQHRAA
ncbi:MAG: hypothetical protein ABS75_25945 [Pelagibacterium sp. SCN 63-23]|nr:MAG: hypothetical protein ABS75_25945 [Pelagibacterium sp. SCN 63-23]